MESQPLFHRVVLLLLQQWYLAIKWTTLTRGNARLAESNDLGRVVGHSEARYHDAVVVLKAAVTCLVSRASSTGRCNTI